MSATVRTRKLFGWLLLSAAFCVLAGDSAAAWPWSRDELPKTDLGRVLEAPHTYKGRTLRFDARFISRGKLFKRLNTRFTENRFENFAVWPGDAELWRAGERRAVVPTLYVPVTDRKLVEKLKDLERYDLLTVTAMVRNDYAGLPWLEVTGIERDETASEALSERTLTHIRHGVTLQEEGKERLAVEQYGFAIGAGLPAVYRSTVYGRLGACRFVLGEYDAAAAAYAEAIAADPEDADLYLGRARVHLRLERPEDVVADCRAVMNLTADRPVVHAMLGEARAMQGRTVEALRLCELTAHAPGADIEVRARAEVHRARIYARAGRYEDAVGAYARAIGENTPLAAVAWLRKEIGAFYEARYDETGNVEYLEEAIREYRNARVISEGRDARGLQMLAEALVKQARDTDGAYDEALEVLQRTEQVAPGYVPARLLRGRIAMIRGESGKAERIFAEIAADHPQHFEARIQLARAYEEQGRIDKALEAYRAAVGIEPADEEAWRRIADIAETLGKTGVARDAYRRLAEIDPDELLYAYQLGRLSLALDDYKTAAAASARAAGEDARGLDAQRNLALALHAAGDVRGAEAALGALVEADPQNARAQAYRARLLADLGANLSEALDLAQAAFEAEPDMPETRDALGWVQHRLGRSGDAVETLRAIPQDVRGRAVWYHLGAAHRALGQYDEAEAALRKATAPLREGEVRGIAEAVRAAAEEMLEETVKDRREAMRLERAKAARAARRKATEEEARDAATGADLPEDGGAGAFAPGPRAAPARIASDDASAAVADDEKAIPVIEGIGRLPLGEEEPLDADAPPPAAPERARAAAPGEPAVETGDEGDDATNEISVEELENLEIIGARPDERVLAAAGPAVPRNRIDLNEAEAAPWIDWESDAGEDTAHRTEAPVIAVDFREMDREREEILRVVQAWKEEPAVAPEPAPAADAAACAPSRPAPPADPTFGPDLPIASARPVRRADPIAGETDCIGPDVGVFASLPQFMD